MKPKKLDTVVVNGASLRCSLEGFCRKSFQVLVRAERGGYRAADKLAMAILELIRRLKNRELRGARVISFNEIRRGVKNDPVQAIEYIETFLLHSTVGKMNHEEEPLTTTGAF